MNVRPLRDGVLIQRLKAEDKSPGGIIIPDNAKERPLRGKVVAVGPGRVTDQGRRVEPQVKKGDVVLFGKYAGAQVDPRDDEQILVREEDIFAVLDE